MLCMCVGGCGGFLFVLFFGGGFFGGGCLHGLRTNCRVGGGVGICSLLDLIHPFLTPQPQEIRINSYFCNETVVYTGQYTTVSLLINFPPQTHSNSFVCYYFCSLDFAQFE